MRNRKKCYDDWRLRSEGLRYIPQEAEFCSKCKREIYEGEKGYKRMGGKLYCRFCLWEEK